MARDEYSPSKRVANCSFDISSEKNAVGRAFLAVAVVTGVRGVECDIGASAVLPIEGRPARMTRSERLQSAHFAVEVAQARRDAGDVAVALVRFLGHFDRRDQRLFKLDKTAIHLAGAGEFEQPLFGRFDLGRRRVVEIVPDRLR